MLNDTDTSRNTMILPVINPGLVVGWYDALLSGNHTQGTGCMESESEGETLQCCLGVLCRVAMAQGIKIPTSKKEISNTEVYFGVEAHAGVLPAEVTDVLFGKIEEADNWDEYCDRDEYRDPYMVMEEGLTKCATAADLNDTHGYTFIQIAACIKRTWPKAFTA